MQSDIVQRLRDYRSRDDWGDLMRHEICDQAAAEIVRLRTALRQIQDEGDIHSNAIATDTLGGSDAE